MRALESTAGPCVCLLAYLVILLPLPSNGATETPESVRWLMVSHMYRGMSIAYIMQACLRSRSTVGRILRLFRKTGTVRPEARSGRPTQLTRSEIYELRKLVSEDPTGYYDEYAIKMSVKTGKTISTSTIHDYMKKYLRYTRKKVCEADSVQGDSLAMFADAQDRTGAPRQPASRLPNSRGRAGPTGLAACVCGRDIQGRSHCEAHTCIWPSGCAHQGCDAPVSWQEVLCAGCCELGRRDGGLGDG